MLHYNRRYQTQTTGIGWTRSKNGQGGKAIDQERASNVVLKKVLELWY